MKSFTEFVREINSEEKCIDYLIEKNIFQNVIQYPKCDKAIKLNRETLFFHCLATSYEAKNKTKRKRVRCSYLKSIRTDTWFENVHLQLLTAVTFIAEWLWYPPPRFGVITNDLHIGSHTFVDWSSFCREMPTHSQSREHGETSEKIFPEMEIKRKICHRTSGNICLREDTAFPKELTHFFTKLPNFSVNYIISMTKNICILNM